MASVGPLFLAKPSFVHLFLTKVGQPYKLLQLLLWIVNDRETQLHQISGKGGAQH